MSRTSTQLTRKQHMTYRVVSLPITVKEHLFFDNLKYRVTVSSSMLQAHPPVSLYFDNFADAKEIASRLNYFCTPDLGTSKTKITLFETEEKRVYNDYERKFQ